VILLPFSISKRSFKTSSVFRVLSLLMMESAGGAAALSRSYLRSVNFSEFGLLIADPSCAIYSLRAPRPLNKSSCSDMIFLFSSFCKSIF
jgi:hypothetical protein